MLRQRVITALVLVALLLGALSVDSAWPFAALTLLLMAAGGWEWGRLNQAGAALSVLMGAAVAAGGAVAWLAGWKEGAPALLWAFALLLWGAGGAVALRSGPAAWPQLPRAARWVLGLAALWLAWLALAGAHGVGINFMLSVLCLVWMADVAAYFGGRAFGRRKLAPSISPGKSWEGVWSGWLGVAVLAAFWIWLDGRMGFDGPSLFSRLFDRWGVVGLLAALWLLAGLSVVGDLVESLVKRAAGAKDSSRLLPGHGGVLDRVDALLPVLPAVMALVALGSLA
jgi:phosphatidate cytidylyltransferase